MFSNWREWLSRYGWAELWGLLTSYLGYYCVYNATLSGAAGAYGAVLGENFGYYGCILWREIAEQRRGGAALSSALAGKVVRNMIVEFGFAELLDSLIVRPGATYLAVSLFGAEAGVLIGKIGADIVFYALTIGFYERRKARERGA